MSLRPLAHRVLVKPDLQPEQSAGGILLPQDRDHVPVSGTVVAVGPGGAASRYQARQRAIRDCCALAESALQMWGGLPALQLLRDEMAGLIGTSDPVCEISVGDRVVYPDDAGLTVVEDGDPYILLNEADVAILVVEGAAAA